jgi:hypothetical protein
MSICMGDLVQGPLSLWLVETYIDWPGNLRVMVASCVEESAKAVT